MDHFLGYRKIVWTVLRYTKEARLLKAFYMHRADIERLRDMLLTDDQVRAVYARFGVETMKSGLPRNPSEVNFPAARYNEYRALLEKIGATEVFRAGEGDSEICVAFGHPVLVEIPDASTTAGWSAHLPIRLPVWTIFIKLLNPGILSSGASTRTGILGRIGKCVGEGEHLLTSSANQHGTCCLARRFAL